MGGRFGRSLIGVCGMKGLISGDTLGIQHLYGLTYYTSSQQGDRSLVANISHRCHLLSVACNCTSSVTRAITGRQSSLISYSTFFSEQQLSTKSFPTRPINLDTFTGFTGHEPK